ncbi:MAG TPA: hypothetical protein VGG01_10400 [Xanthobacteraceae bacterium]|jgi:hypothetical protein
MAVLIIVRLPNKWVIRVAGDTNRSWDFQGVDLKEQEASVEYLADSMREGLQSVIDNIYEIVGVQGNVSARQTVQAIFGDTDGIQLNGNMVFNDADNMLLNVLEDAGEALFAAL